ncbi:MAG: murein hydrolase activator EnvC family protein [Rhizobiaceae bacterium]
MTGRKTSSTSLVRGAIAAALLCLLALPPALASGEEAARLEEQRLARISERERLMDRIALSDERAAALSAEIEQLAKDHETLTAALVRAAQVERQLSEDVERISTRLAGLAEERDYLRASLSARRGVLAEVLGALQRMGRNPPPAMLVRPDDALASVRSAILLGAVVPELRAETEVLIADLNELSRVAAQIEAEQDRLVSAMMRQAEERQRMSLLAEEKQRLQARSQARLERERERAAELAERAGSLEELIASLAAEIETAQEAEAARQAELAARRAEEERRRQEAREAGQELEAATQFAALPFNALTGQVALPVQGFTVARFGDDDEAGGRLSGDIVRTHSGAIVTAPSDGSVLYAGPFRSYGQLLILNAGDGYHLVLAGMSRISVRLGQNVVAGEPIGAMGEARVASVAISGDEDSGPELYIEFRKEGKPVDPAPWWAERNSVRAGNDT